MQGRFYLSDWVQKLVPNTLIRFHQSVAISLNWSLTAKFYAQPPAVDSFIAMQICIGSMARFAIGDLFTCNPTRSFKDNNNKKKPNPVDCISGLVHLLHVKVWSCSISTGTLTLDLKVRGSTPHTREAFGLLNISSYLYWAWKCSWTKLCRSRGCCVLDEVKVEGCSSEVDPCRHGGRKQFLMEYSENCLKAK